MAVLSSEQFARLLLRQSTAALTAFVADCYGARGWAVTRRRDGLVARNPRTGAAERVAVLGSRTRLTAPASVDADVVVARRDASWARAVAATSDARFVGPAELRDVLLYGLDRDVARGLLSDHFGTSLEARVGPTVTVAAVATVALVAVVVAATVGGAALFAAGPSWSSTPSAVPETATPEPTSAEFSGRPAPNTVSTFPPGLDDDGVRSVEAVAQGHRTAVAGRSYDLLFEQRRTRSADFDGRWDESRQFATVENRTNYFLIVEGTDPRRAANESRVRYVAYGDGERVYVKTWDENGTPRYVSRGIDPEAESPFTASATTYVVRYLDTSRTDLSRVVYRGREVYLVTAVGTPQRIPGNVTDYRATAIVYPDGFVTELDATYTVESGNETRHVEIRYTYDDVGTATVERPEWVDRPSGGNRTPTPVGPD
jgi:hypothetical protein